jgi:hypothetical protein
VKPVSKKKNEADAKSSIYSMEGSELEAERWKEKNRKGGL